MTISGPLLGAELGELRHAARHTLPEAAGLYAQASRHLHDSSWLETEAFEQTESRLDLFITDGDGAGFETVADMGEVYPHWVALRDALQIAFARTSDNLMAAAVAVDQIVEAYAAQDESAAKRLRTKTANLPDTIPSIPDSRYPNDEHDTHVEEWFGLRAEVLDEEPTP